MQKLISVFLALSVGVLIGAMLSGPVAIAQEQEKTTVQVANLVEYIYYFLVRPQLEHHLEEKKELDAARDLLQFAEERAKHALQYRDRSRFNKWLNFLEKVRHQRTKSKALNALHEDADYILTNRLPKKFMVGFVGIGDDGTVLADPDPRMQALLHRELQLNAAGGGGIAGAD